MKPIIDPRIAPPEPFGAIIFDCDGTLADTMPLHFKAWHEVLKENGADFSEELFYSMAGVPTRTIIEHINKDYGHTMDVESVYHEKENRYLTLMAGVTEIVAVANIARTYHGVVPMAVASGGAHDIVDATLTITGLKPLFQAIVTADDVVHGKPSPDMFLLAAEKLGVAPESCIVYEDGEPGIIGAKAAGMRVVDVRVLFANGQANSVVGT